MLEQRIAPEMQRRGKEKRSTCVVIYRWLKVENDWSNQQLSDHLSSSRKQRLWGPVLNTHWADSLPILSQQRVSLTTHCCSTTPQARGSQLVGHPPTRHPWSKERTGCCSLLPEERLAQARMMSKAASSPGAPRNVCTHCSLQRVKASPRLNRVGSKDTSEVCACLYYD